MNRYDAAFREAMRRRGREETVLTEAMERTAAEENVSLGTAMMRVMAVAIMRIADDIPFSLRHALVDGLRRWFDPQGERVPLGEHRVAAWQYLRAHNLNYWPNTDKTFVAVRALIHILWDDEVSDHDVGDVIDSFAVFALLHEGLRSSV